eukprot:15437578-Alexandrium_andersonii.AAC.1
MVRAWWSAFTAASRGRSSRSPWTRGEFFAQVSALRYRLVPARDVVDVADRGSLQGASDIQ